MDRSLSVDDARARIAELNVEIADKAALVESKLKEAGA